MELITFFDEHNTWIYFIGIDKVYYLYKIKEYAVSIEHLNFI